MATYNLVRKGNTGNNNSYTAGGGITIKGDTISTNPTEDLVISGDKIGIKPTYVQDNFYVTGTTLVREVADGTKVNLDFTDLINHIESNSGGDTSELENQISNLRQQVTNLDDRVTLYAFIDNEDHYRFTTDDGSYYFILPKPKYSLSVNNDGQLTLNDEVFGYNANVKLPQGTISYDPETNKLTYDLGIGDGTFTSAAALPTYSMTVGENLIGFENIYGSNSSYIELGEGLSSDSDYFEKPDSSYAGILKNTGQVVKLTDGLGKSMLLPQGGDISSSEYKTGYYYVEGNDLPSNPIKDGLAYYVTKEYYGSMNFKLTATHSITGRTFVGVNSDMADLVWKELTSGV